MARHNVTIKGLLPGAFRTDRLRSDAAEAPACNEVRVPAEYAEGKKLAGECCARRCRISKTRARRMRRPNAVLAAISCVMLPARFRLPAALPALSPETRACMRQALRDAAASPPQYERRRPEETTLYRVVQENLETFLAQVEAEGAASLPQFVKDDFDAFLECGILAHGFLRMRCAACGHEKLWLFPASCAAYAPRAGGRRMAETAAWLVDRVIPKVPVRQWVLSFPIPLRSLFAVHPELLAPVLQIIHPVIAMHLIKQAGIKRSEAATGAVTLIQRFGSAANLNIHLHGLVLDGVYCTSAEGAPVFRPAPALTGEELQALLGKIITRVLRLLTREGHLVEEEGVTYVADTHGIIDPENVLAPLQAASCTYRIAFGPRAGCKVLSLQYAASRAAPITQPLCANAHGFSLHAGVRCAAEQRSELEHLCRYITRPAIANERLSVNHAGQVVLKLKTPYRDGTSHLVMSPLEFMQRLAALVPHPRLHLIRFHGVLTPNARLRSMVTPGGQRTAASEKSARQQRVDSGQPAAKTERPESLERALGRTCSNFR